MLSQKIRDKDGVSAAVRLPAFSFLTYSPSLTAPPLPLSLDVQACFAELASSLYSRGSTLKAHLEELYAKFVSVAPPRLFFSPPLPLLTPCLFLLLSKIWNIHHPELLLHLQRPFHDREDLPATSIRVPFLGRGRDSLRSPASLGGSQSARFRSRWDSRCC